MSTRKFFSKFFLELIMYATKLSTRACSKKAEVQNICIIMYFICLNFHNNTLHTYVRNAKSYMASILKDNYQDYINVTQKKLIKIKK